MIEVVLCAITLAKSSNGSGLSWDFLVWPGIWSY